MKPFTLVIFVLLSAHQLHGQIYQGPASGSVSAGAVVSTESMEFVFQTTPTPIKRLRNKLPFEPFPSFLNPNAPDETATIHFVTDPGASAIVDLDSNLIRSFQGFLDPGNYIPPDPYIAAGPNHVMGVDNDRFRIWDKSGRLILTSGIDPWFSTTATGLSIFDPKVIYDHFDKRWIMVWLHQDDVTATSYYLVSVSDDSIPTGTWYNWALPGNVNGSTPITSWADYQGVGYDSVAVYLTSNQFNFGGSFTNSKIRIIPKSDLYANTAGVVNWTDLWDIRQPGNLSPSFGIRPSRMYGSPGEYYLVTHSTSGVTNYITLYKLTNPLTAPSMTAANVTVGTYYNPPNANQLGGGSPLIDGGGYNIRNEPVFIDGHLHLVHCVASGTSFQYSSVRYVRMDPALNSAVEDVALGADTYYYFYPALAVDKDNNVVLTFSRSATTEYAGAFYTYRLSTDPINTLRASRPLQPGKANYVKTFSGTRNRWGDYNGAWVDPLRMDNFWLFTEYAETPANTWAVWAANLRLSPFTGARLYASKDSVLFPNLNDAWNAWPVGSTSDTFSVSLYNLGADTLYVSHLGVVSDVFHINESLNFPLAIAQRETMTVSFRFTPSEPGSFLDTITIESNDAVETMKYLPLRGLAYSINPVSSGVLYSGTGSGSGGVMLTLDPNTGAGSLIGPSGFTEVRGLTVHPASKVLYATSGVGSSSNVSRINASAGDAHQYRTFNLSSVRGIAFDRTTHELYGARTNGLLVKMDLESGDTTFVGLTGISNLYSLSFNPLTNEMWGLQWNSTNSKLFRINKQTGASTEVGPLGQGQAQSMAFDQDGKLFALIGIPSAVTQLARIDTSTGTATTIGNLNFIHGLSLAVDGSVILDVHENPVGGLPPAKFELYQNFPNPFNPTTNIRFGIPSASLIRLRIYNLLGQQVKTLVHGYRGAGKWDVTWDGTNDAGKLVSSGVYLYRLEAGTYTNTKKLLLMK